MYLFDPITYFYIDQRPMDFVYFRKTLLSFRRIKDMKVIPLEDRVLIKTAELEEKTKSGLFIPQTAQEKTQVGVVTAIGSDKEAIKVKVGQKIMYDKYAGTSIKVDGADYLIIKSKDILAVIED